MRFIFNRKGIKGICSCLAVSLVCGAVLSLGGCGLQPNERQNDILTQKTGSGNRMKITVLVKHAFTATSFEKAVEEKFPDIDIVLVGNFTRDMGISEYSSRMEHDDLTDIVMTWPLDAGEEYWEDRLLDLSGYDFTSKYNLSMLNEISQDGKLYYLPGPSQVRGIVYNKTLFDENGWDVPSDFEGFISLCKEIEASGIRSLQLGFGNEEVLDTGFVGFSYGECYSQPQDTQWMKEYDQGRNSFGDHFSPALDTFQRLIDENVFREEDLNITYADRENMFFTRKCAMVEDSVLMAKMGYSKTGTTDEYALMPFFNPGDGSEWVRLYMVCYIGLNKKLAESGNKEKYNNIIKIMEYISTPEGQEALMEDNGTMFSSLIGVMPENVPEIEALIPSLEQGHYGIFPQLKNAKTALRQGLTGMLKGEYTKEDVIKMVDKQNADPIIPQVPVTVGEAREDFTLIETGNFITDVLRESSGCEISLFLDGGKDGLYNGKGVSGRFYKGDITKEDVGRILPDLKHGETGTLWKITMTGEDLINTLEYSIKVDNDIDGWFYYFSGLRVEFEPTGEPGARIHKITTEDGKSIDKEKLYSIAVMDATVPEEYIKSCEETDELISDIINNAITAQKTISPGKDGRFVVVSK